MLLLYNIFKISPTDVSPLDTRKQVSASKTSRNSQVSDPGTALTNCATIHIQMSQAFIHSLRTLSYDMSIASSKASSTQNAI
jgi:hypothetical protein